MRLDELERKGGFTSSQLTKIPVEWKRIVDDKEVTDNFFVFLRKPSFAGFDRIHSANMQGQSLSAMTIAETVSLGKEGEERISYDKAAQLETTLAVAILDAITKHAASEIAPKKKPVRTKKKSGTS